MTIASEITRLQNDKAAMCTAIENKGVTVGNVTMDSYAACIDAIQAGGEKVGYIDFLMVGGGGAGSNDVCCSTYGYGGGGGGGGFIECFGQAIFEMNYPVKIGQGGCGKCCCIDARGGDTIFYGVAYGGGGESYCRIDCCTVERAFFRNGASGAFAGSAIYGSQGNNGGVGICCNSGGGGGGAGEAGCKASTTAGGKGGDGRCSCMSGECCWYAGGGGGGTEKNVNYGGEGGLGGGGHGTYMSCCACDATYYGGGGGGSGRSSIAGNGYQGIVIIRYKSDGSCGIVSATGGDNCYVCNGYCIHTFTNDGIFTPILQ